MLACESVVVARWTIDRVMAEDPCLSRDAIAAYFGEATSLALAEILAHPDLPTPYQLWMARRPAALSPSIRTRWVDMIVTRAVRAYAWPHAETRTWAACWLDGTDRSAKTAMVATAAAGTRAAWAAEEAARAAAEAAAGTAAGAEAAARAAVRAAGAGAGWAAAAAMRSQEEGQQVADLQAIMFSQETLHG